MSKKPDGTTGNRSSPKVHGCRYNEFFVWRDGTEMAKALTTKNYCGSELSGHEKPIQMVLDVPAVVQWTNA